MTAACHAKAAAFAVTVLFAALPSAKAEAPNVLATIKPIHSLAASVMAGVGEPRLLIDGGASPHTFTLKPSDAKALSKARIIFRVSNGLEPFMAKIVKSLPKSVEVVELEKAPGLELHRMRAGGAFESHDDGAAHKHSPGHGHGKGKTATDSHIWLDPANGARMARHMADVLAKADPANAARYTANAETLAGDLTRLGEEIAEATRVSAGRPFIVFHDAYQYFERRFGLAAAGSVTISPDIAPSAKRLGALRQKVMKLGAVCIFSEPQFEPKLVASIAEGSRARAGVLDPLGAELENGPGLYPALLRVMAKAINGCLADPA